MKKLTGAFSLDVAKAFNTVWVNGLLYKLTIFNFFLYLVKTISSYLHGRFKASFQTATPTCYCMCTGVAQGGIISFILFSPYVHMPCLLTTSKWLSTQTTCLSHHVLPASAVRQIPGDIPQQPTAVAERMEVHHQRLEEHCDALH